jgi:hypothetical protein
MNPPLVLWESNLIVSSKNVCLALQNPQLWQKSYIILHI